MVGKEAYNMLIKQTILLTIVNKTDYQIPEFPPKTCGNDGQRMRNGSAIGLNANERQNRAF